MKTDRSLSSLFPMKYLTSDKRRILYENALNTATHYDEWYKAANRLDEIDGLDQWKKELECADYDWELIYSKLQQLREIRSSDKGQSAMIFALRTSLARNIGDMGNPKLYANARVGTKELISDYIDEVLNQLNWICDEPAEEGLGLKEKHDFFMNMRQSFGRTALLLSGGGALGIHHMGVVRCLYEANLLPRIISGASCGSIIASLVCVKTADELGAIFDPTNIRLDVFEREGCPETALMRIHRLLSNGTLFDVSILRDAIRSNLGDITFQEAFNRTRWILNITVSSSTLYDMPQLLNYLTAPDVVIWSAVAASCSVPVFYGSTSLYSKDKCGRIAPWNMGDQLYIDGSVNNDLPMNKLSELFNVNHFIVCQVNPHVIPFIQKTNAPSNVRQAANFCMHMAKTEVQHRCTQLTELGVIPSFFNKVQSIMSQKYSGDITIIPEIEYSDFLKILSNPTPSYALNCTMKGERATWPKMSIIKNHLQIELAIDQILYRLRLRRLNEISRANKPIRPSMEIRSTSQFNVLQPIYSPVESVELVVQSSHSTPTQITEEIEEEEVKQKEIKKNEQKKTEEEVKKKTEEVKMKEDVIKDKTRERKSTKRGLLMTKPE
ncbi:acyl transferase/acyl hydrolase/lysophospholipase [Pilobolus umbonatus]|nr:acyl transferase/acyl hydrolase/lysophospholipase [Pilobolus umbonatus]